MTLRITDLASGYGRQAHIVNGVDLTVGRGELIGLLGPNGSGKSTLIKTIAGINAVRTGSLNWDDTVDLTALSRRELAKIVAYVPQSIAVSFALTVHEAVLLGRTPHFGARPTQEDFDFVERAIEQLGLAELADREVSELSGGQAQRVLIARALAQNPSILLLDEPTSALDIKYQWQTLELAGRFARENDIAALIAIHDLNQAARFCDRVVFLRQGRVLADGPAVDVYSTELIREAYGVDVALSTYRGYVEIHPAPSGSASLRDISNFSEVDRPLVLQSAR